MITTTRYGASNSTSANCQHAWYTVAAFAEPSTTAEGMVYSLRERCVHCGITRDDLYTGTSQ